MEELTTQKKRVNYDYILVLATTVVLFMIALITLYGMFHFKYYDIGETKNVAVKIAYFQLMNRLISPFLSALLVILSICVPKRLFPFRLLNFFGAGMIILTIVLSVVYGNTNALTVVLFIALALQFVVFVLVLFGMKLHFEKEGYWTRLGSSLVHLGFILFVLDFMFLNSLEIHMTIFWLSTVSISLGCLFTFYTSSLNKLVDLVFKRVA
ncbi:hypothetical protein ACFL2A_02740 [Thermodesulfobacteriota bacterium]